MPNATFSGHSGYRLEVSATRSGKRITISVGVRRTGSLLAWWTGTQPWSITLNGTKTDYTWNYDFRNKTWESLGSRSHTFTTIGSKSYSVTVAMGSGIGTATVSGSVTIPPDAPAKPTNLVVNRSSDTRQNLSFRGNASTNAPYTLTQVQRQERSSRTSWGTWKNVLNRSGTKTSQENISWADTGTTSNKLYRYRAIGYNSTGQAISDVSREVYTTPAAPTKITAESISNTQVKVTVEENLRHTQFNTLLEYRVGTGSWQTLTTLGKNVNEHTFTPPTGASVTVRGRIKIVASGQAGDGLTSGYRESNVVPLQAPPLKPTSLSPNGTILDVTKVTELSWVYTSADTSGQTAYQISIRKDGASSWTEMAKVYSSSKSALMFANYFDISGYDWRVRTWGVHADPSPYSDPAHMEFAEAPVTAVLAPLGVAIASRATLEWDPVDGQALWRATLYHDGAPVETRSGSGGASSVTFNTPLVNGDSYSVTIEVADGTGLWSEPAEGDFEARFPSPAAPDFEVSWDPEQGSSLINITNPQPTPRNLATNPRMERIVDGKVADIGPVFGAGATATYSDESPLTGSHVLRYEVAAGTTAAVLPVSDIDLPYDPLPPLVTVIVRVRVNAPVQAAVAAYDPLASLSEIPAGEWVTLRNTAQPVYETSSFGGVIVGPLDGETSIAATHIDIDSALVVEGEYNGPYFDGETPGAVWEGDPDDSPSTWADAAYNSVYRSYDGEEWTLVADGLPLDTSVLDPEPALNQEAFYQVRAVSELGTVGSSETNSVFTFADQGFWSSGDNFSVLQTLRMDLGGPPGLDLDTGLAFKNLHYFAGRTSPLEFAGDATARTGTAHFMVGSVAERNTVEQLATMRAPHLFRLPDGVTMYASVGIANIVRQDDGFYTVSIPVQEVQR